MDASPREVLKRISIALGFYFTYTFVYLVPLQIHFGKSGAFAVEPMWSLFALGAVCIAAIAMLLPTTFETTNLFLWLVFTMIVVPRVATSSLSGDGHAYALLCLVFYALAAAASVWVKTKTPARSLSVFKSRNLLMVIVALIGALIVALFVWCAISMGVPTLDAFNYENTYDIRESNSFGFVESGLLSLTCTRIIPALLCYCVITSCWWFAIILTIAQIAFFLWTANKAWLLLLVLVWFVGILVKKRLVNVCRLLVGVLVVLIAMSIPACFLAGGAKVVFSIGVRRLIVIPATLGQGYFDFFSAGNPIVALQNTILSPFTPMPEQYLVDSYAVQVGQFLYGSDSTAYANTGLFGGEIANFGPIAGLVVTGLNVFIICYMLKLIRRDANQEYVYVVIVMSAFLLLNISTIRFLFSPTGLVGTLFTLYLAFAPSLTKRHAQQAPSDASSQLQSGFADAHRKCHGDVENNGR